MWSLCPSNLTHSARILRMRTKCQGSCKMSATRSVTWRGSRVTSAVAYSADLTRSWKDMMTSTLTILKRGTTSSRRQRLRRLDQEILIPACGGPSPRWLKSRATGITKTSWSSRKRAPWANLTSAIKISKQLPKSMRRIISPKGKWPRVPVLTIKWLPTKWWPESRARVQNDRHWIYAGAVQRWLESQKLPWWETASSKESSQRWRDILIRRSKERSV